MKIAVLFPGQGSQFLGMGQEFVDSSADCKAIMETSEEVCQARIGDLCKNGPMEELTKAEFLQPAITAVNLMCWRMFAHEISGKVDVSYFAGHSLGEYSALHAAGVVSVEDTIRLVAKRGSLMGREGQKNPGGMRAVLGLNIDEIEKVIAQCSEGIVTAANHNTEQQIVISGDSAGLNAVSGKLEEAGAKIIPLNVSVANHSPLVADAVPEFAEFMRDISFSKPLQPVLFNVTAGPESDVTAIKDIMARQIASRVRWYETITTMLNDGVDTFIEVGPKTVLKGMMRKIVPKGIKVTSLQFDSPQGLVKCIEKIV